MSKTLKIILLLTSGLIFGLVLWGVEPPKSLTSSSPIQILIFFAPLLIFLITFTNLFLNYLLINLLVGMGVIILLILKGTNYLNPLTALVILTAIILLLIFGIYKKPRYKSYQPKIPKLSYLSKQR